MCNIETLIKGSHDVGISFENEIVDAESMGLGTCHIGALGEKLLKLTKTLNFPKYCIPLVGLCVVDADKSSWFEAKNNS